MKIKILFLVVTALLCAYCTTNQNENASSASQMHEVKYAKGFDINHTDSYVELVVFSPWAEGAVQQRIYLVDDMSTPTPADGLKLKRPISSIAISSCTHTEPLQLIGEIDNVVGVCAPELIYNESLVRRFANDSIASLGDAYNVNLEKLLMLHPDAYMVASYNSQDANATRLVQAGVPVVFNNEWTETSLLARAEWIKYVAAFYAKEHVADSIFAEIEKNYNEALNIVPSDVHRPKVMAGNSFKGTWYMPGGQSYMGRLFADAGADYFYAADSTTTSLALNFEQVLHHFADADVWLNAPATTIDELVAMEERHLLFRPAREKNVFAFYKRTTENGANDFWESAVSHPDLVLKDMIWALHPSLLPDYEPVYIIKLE